jgi:uncharacterized Zn finger protein
VAQDLTRTVEGSKGNKYIVTCRDDVWSCSCPHHRYRGARCKHIIRVQSDVGSNDVDDWMPDDFFQ